MDKLHSRENKHTPGPEEEKGFISITLAFSAFLQARHRGKAAEGLIRTRPTEASAFVVGSSTARRTRISGRHRMVCGHAAPISTGWSLLSLR